MKKTAILISILLISASAFSQNRVIPVANRYFPKNTNQITKEDSLALRDDYGIERPFQGVEEDTAAINADFLRREKLKEGKITDPEREVVTFDYESIIYTDMRDFEKAEAERKKFQKASPANKK